MNDSREIRKTYDAGLTDDPVVVNAFAGGTTSNPMAGVRAAVEAHVAVAQIQRLQECNPADAIEFLFSGRSFTKPEIKELAKACGVSISTVRRAIKSDDNADPAFLTVHQAADVLAVSDRHVYDLVKEGAIPCVRHGRAIRIAKEHLDEYNRDAERQPIKTTGFRHLT